MTKNISVKRLECDGKRSYATWADAIPPPRLRRSVWATCTPTSATSASASMSLLIPAKPSASNRITVTVAAWMNFYR